MLSKSSKLKDSVNNSKTIIDNNTVFAPVIIPTLCRYEHFKRCVESLSRCTHADKTELIIGLDYPLKESHVKGYSKILDFVNNDINGFGKVTVLKQNKNLGAVLNYRYVLDYAFNIYDSVIISEDDNEFSPNFLDYINKGLIQYKNIEDVVAVCGYNYPINMTDYPANAYLSHNFSAWGCGIWKSKNEKYLKELTSEKCRKILKSPLSMLKLLVQKPTLAISLEYTVRHKCMLGDVNREVYNIVNNHRCLFPRLSMVRNWGHDGSGVNCGNYDNDIYLKQPVDNSSVFNLSPNIKVLPRKFNKRLRKFFRDRPQDLIYLILKIIKKKFFNSWSPQGKGLL